MNEIGYGTWGPWSSWTALYAPQPMGTGLTYVAMKLNPLMNLWFRVRVAGICSEIGSMELTSYIPPKQIETNNSVLRYGMPAGPTNLERAAAIRRTVSVKFIAPKPLTAASGFAPNITFQVPASAV